MAGLERGARFFSERFEELVLEGMVVYCAVRLPPLPVVPVPSAGERLGFIT